MATTAFAAPAMAVPAAFGSLPRPRRSRQWFGDITLGIFLLTQLLDGLCTYQGVQLFGIDVEANPLVAGLMIHLGHGPGLLSAKILASGFGICLYIRRVHGVVALLAGIYLTAAIGPWTAILFF
jgi:uncharacterized protein DUF5658